MRILIIGGAGFIGCNAAEFYAKKGDQVVVLDNLSRPGTDLNLAYVQEKYPEVRFIRGDVRHSADLDRVFAEATYDAVFHLASQVAVTTSVKNPREDFEINALGTFNVLEAMRAAKSRALLIYASTNKVYGGMDDVVVVEKGGRYQYRDYPQGLSEQYGLDFHSPYGCSKGAGDQYVRDYSRIYGLRTVVFRQSCIYGYRQFGIEDQGWVAWFTLAAAAGMPITLYGDGKQVRDVLFIDDLLEAYDLAIRKSEATCGRVYNIGGGPSCQLSLLDLLRQLEALTERTLEVRRGDWRPGDQRVFVADVGKAHREFGWSPRTPVEEGIERLHAWISGHLPLFRKVGLIR